MFLHVLNMVRRMLDWLIDILFDIEKMLNWRFFLIIVEKATKLSPAKKNNNK